MLIRTYFSMIKFKTILSMISVRFGAGDQRVRAGAILPVVN